MRKYSQAKWTVYRNAINNQLLKANQALKCDMRFETHRVQDTNSDRVFDNNLERTQQMDIKLRIESSEGKRENV